MLLITPFFSTETSGEIKREAENLAVALQCAVTDCRGSSDLFIIGICFVTNKNRLLLNEIGNSYQHDNLCNLSNFLVAYKNLLKNYLCTLAFCLHFQTTVLSFQVWSKQERCSETSVFTESCKGSYLYKVSLPVWTLLALLVSFSSPSAVDRMSLMLPTLDFWISW